VAVRQTQRAVAGDQEITNDLRRLPLSLLYKNSSSLAGTLVEPARAFSKSQALVRAGRRRAIPFQREMVLSETSKPRMRPRACPKTGSSEGVKSRSSREKIFSPPTRLRICRSWSRRVGNQNGPSGPQYWGALGGTSRNIRPGRRRACRIRRGRTWAVYA